MNFATSCQYCNTRIILAQKAPRVDCPRCGESLRPAAWIETDDLAGDTPSERPASRRGWILLVLLVAVAASVLAYFQLQPNPPTREEPLGPAITSPPASLVGLKMLPPSCNVVVATQPAALIGFLDPEKKLAPSRVLAGIGIPELLLAKFESAGVKLEETDQIVLGAAIVPELPIPGVTLVLRLRRPLTDEDRFLEAFEAQKITGGDQPVFSLPLFGDVVKLMKQDERTWVFCNRDADLAFARQPASSIAHLPHAIRQSLAERIDPASYAYMATDYRNWGEANTLLAFGKKSIAKRLGKARALAAGIAQTADGPKLFGTLECDSDANAAEAKAMLEAALGAKATVEAKSATVKFESVDEFKRLSQAVKLLLEPVFRD